MDWECSSLRDGGEGRIPEPELGKGATRPRRPLGATSPWPRSLAAPVPCFASLQYLAQRLSYDWCLSTHLKNLLADHLLHTSNLSAPGPQIWSSCPSLVKLVLPKPLCSTCLPSSDLNASSYHLLYPFRSQTDTFYALRRSVHLKSHKLPSRSSLVHPLLPNLFGIALHRLDHSAPLSIRTTPSLSRLLNTTPSSWNLFCVRETLFKILEIRCQGRHERSALSPTHRLALEGLQCPYTCLSCCLDRTLA